MRCFERSSGFCKTGGSVSLSRASPIGWIKGTGRHGSRVTQTDPLVLGQRTLPGVTSICRNARSGRRCCASEDRYSQRHDYRAFANISNHPILHDGHQLGDSRLRIAEGATSEQPSPEGEELRIPRVNPKRSLSSLFWTRILVLSGSASPHTIHACKYMTKARHTL
jgi:hypothetical protein